MSNNKKEVFGISRCLVYILLSTTIDNNTKSTFPDVWYIFFYPLLLIIIRNRHFPMSGIHSFNTTNN